MFCFPLVRRVLLANLLFRLRSAIVTSGTMWRMMNVTYSLGLMEMSARWLGWLGKKVPELFVSMTQRDITSALSFS